MLMCGPVDTISTVDTVARGCLANLQGVFKAWQLLARRPAAPWPGVGTLPAPLRCVVAKNERRGNGHSGADSASRWQYQRQPSRSANAESAVYRISTPPRKANLGPAAPVVCRTFALDGLTPGWPDRGPVWVRGVAGTEAAFPLIGGAGELPLPPLRSPQPRLSRPH